LVGGGASSNKRRGTTGPSLFHHLRFLVRRCLQLRLEFRRGKKSRLTMWTADLINLGDVRKKSHFHIPEKI
jgi:hypothetical protein